MKDLFGIVCDALAVGDSGGNDILFFSSQLSTGSPIKMPLLESQVRTALRGSVVCYGQAGRGASPSLVEKWRAEARGSPTSKTRRGSSPQPIVGVGDRGMWICLWSPRSYGRTNIGKERV